MKKNNPIKRFSFGIIAFFILISGAYAEEDLSKTLESMPEGYHEYTSTFSNSAIDLSNEPLLPTKELIGHSYKLKDDEDKVKLTYIFKNDFTYSFKTEAFFFTIIIKGKYEIGENELLLYPEKPEAKFCGIKVKNMKIDDSAYDPETFDCYVFKNGILLDDDFYSKK